MNYELKIFKGKIVCSEHILTFLLVSIPQTIQYNDYSHSICVVLDIIGNPELI
jgi:hypothetical protein